MHVDLNWIISTQGKFLEQFGFTSEKIIEEYNIWKSQNSEDLTTNNFLGELLRKATLHNMKYANSVLEYRTNNAELITRTLECSNNLSRENRDYLKQILYLDKMVIFKETLPYKFNIQIKANHCCSYCDKQDSKVYSFENVLEKKYLPHKKCANEKGCECTYMIVALNDK